MADDEEGVFEIVDHSAASQWERFVASICELLSGWRLGSDLSASTLLHSSFLAQSTGTEAPAAHSGVLDEIVLYNNQSYSLTYFPAVAGNPDTRWRTRHHTLQEWHDVGDMLLLGPNTDDVVAQSTATMLLSSLCLAQQEAGTLLPCFVPVGHLADQRYIGSAMLPDGIELNFSVSLERRIPKALAHLPSLWALLESKIPPRPAEEEPQSLIPTCSARYAFDMHNSYRDEWRSSIVPSANPFHVLSWGPLVDPLGHISLSAEWSALPEESVTDIDFGERLDVAAADAWRASAHFRKRIRSPAAASFRQLVAAALELCSVSLEGLVDVAGDDGVGARLVNTVESTLQHVLGSARRGNASDIQSPIYIAAAVAATFGESAPRVDRFDGGDSDDDDDRDAEKPAEKDRPAADAADQVDSIIANVKSAPPGSVAWRIGILLASLIEDRSMQALAQFWNEFVRRTRLSWEGRVPVKCVPAGPPNLRNCLLHQKLQMLNYCIVRSRARSSRLDPERSFDMADSPSPLDAGAFSDTDVVSNSGAYSDPELIPSDVDDSDDDDDVFYDTFESAEDAASGGMSGAVSRGANRQLDALYLLENPSRPLMVPHTQDLGAMTEDMVEEQQAVFEQLGTSADGALARARLQVASLESDMSAFKAANPGCVLQDFVRWHSPNDWAPEGTAPLGRLSARMEEPGNLWRTTWEAVPAVPADKQKPLFNAEQEANKVLHYIENLSIAELIEQMLPIVCVAFIESLLRCEQLRRVPSVTARLGEFTDRVSRFPWRSLSDMSSHTVDALNELLLSMQRAEDEAARATSLLSQLPGQAAFVEKLLASDTSPVLLDRHERALIGKLFVESSGRMAFASPESREFVISVTAPRPHCSSRPVPLRMYASFRANELRIAETLGQDTVFLQ